MHASYSLGNSFACINSIISLAVGGSYNFCCMCMQRSCHNESLHPEVRYTESSAAWVLIAAIIVFFMVQQCCFVYSMMFSYRKLDLCCWKFLSPEVQKIGYMWSYWYGAEIFNSVCVSCSFLFVSETSRCFCQCFWFFPDRL